MRLPYKFKVYIFSESPFEMEGSITGGLVDMVTSSVILPRDFMEDPIKYKSEFERVLVKSWYGGTLIRKGLSLLGLVASAATAACYIVECGYVMFMLIGLAGIVVSLGVEELASRVLARIMGEIEREVSRVGERLALATAEAVSRGSRTLLVAGKPYRAVARRGRGYIVVEWRLMGV